MTRKPLLLCCLSLALAGCGHSTQSASAPATVTGLRVAVATTAQIPSASPLVGTVHAEETANLSAQMVGRVTTVLVHEGDTVHTGQVLVRLDNTEARAGVDQAQSAAQAAQHRLDAAKAQAALAASTLARYQVLREQKSMSPQEYDEVARHAEEASAQLDAARADLAAQKAAVKSAGTLAGYAAIVAPFAGIVTARRVDPGVMAAPGMDLIDVDRSGPLQLQVTVDESLLRDLQVGSALSVSVPSAYSQTVTGHVARIVPAADPASHSFLVKINLPPSHHLLAGMYGTASLDASMHTAVLVPRSAIVAHGSIDSVWVLDTNQIASLRYVTLGASAGDDVEILSGLSTGEQVVLAPGDRELGGKQIEAQQ
ncbi:MAG TPA: efflux RND transporter periplasmic adaptor subunit [Terracidiphilus sp.]|nr:efflux RND transporter periplasmic adaptor subunit [Terracidiphilus sp.]